MFTRYIRDEEGNKRVYDTWETGCPKNSMTADELRRHYPNATEGIEFCTRFSGDDWTFKGDTRISPAYWDLPDFLGPDLAAPRDVLPRRVAAAKSREEIVAAAKAAGADPSYEYRMSLFNYRPTANDYLYGGGAITCSKCSWTGTLKTAADYEAESKYFVDWTCPDCAHENVSGGVYENPSMRDAADDESESGSANPGLRCSICAGLDLPESFHPDSKLNEASEGEGDEDEPLVDPHFVKEMIREAMVVRGMTRKDLATALASWLPLKKDGSIPAGRWNTVYRHVDKWLHSDGKSGYVHRAFFEAALKLEKDALDDAIAKDKALSRALTLRDLRAINEAAPERPPVWAELIRDDAGWRYRHRLCGREIHEDDRVDSFRTGYTRHDGRKLEYIEEVWTTEKGTPRTTVVFPRAAVGGLDDWFLSSLAEACVREVLKPSGVLRTDEYIFVDMA